MRFVNVVLLVSTATALSFPEISSITNVFARKDGDGSGGSDSGNGGNGKCPTIWNDISKTLTKKFSTGGQCNPDARAAIRLIFHDCGAWNKAQGAKGGCDGSLILAGELQRGENKGLEGIGKYIQDLAKQYKVGVADLTVFAGNHAIVTCPGGPRVKTYIGRADSTTAAPGGLLPDVSAPAADFFKLFQDKGFDERDLAALLGAHSTSNQFKFDTSPDKVGLSQDSTSGFWDVKYYSETLNPLKKGIVVFSKLARFGRVGKEFQGFIGNAGKWNGKFADAMGKMALFDAGTSGMSDCTDALPKATNAKREMRGMPVFAPRS